MPTAISVAAFAQPGTCAGMSLGPLASLNGFVPFPSTSLWNTDISSAQVDPNSANLIDYIGASVTLHPDFGSGLYDGTTMGIPYQIEAGAQPLVPVKFTEYGSESDPGPMPIPANALIEGYPAPGDGDRHAFFPGQASIRRSAGIPWIRAGEVFRVHHRRFRNSFKVGQLRSSGHAVRSFRAPRNLRVGAFNRAAS